MRWILPGLATVLLLAQEPLPVKKPTPEQLRKEIAKLENDLKHLREINNLKDALEAAKRALAEERLPLKDRKKIADKRKDDRLKESPKTGGTRWVFMPDPMPPVRPQSARILRDLRGVWWVVMRDKWHRVALNEFGSKQNHKEDAENWVKKLRADRHIK